MAGVQEFPPGFRTEEIATDDATSTDAEVTKQAHDWIGDPFPPLAG